MSAIHRSLVRALTLLLVAATLAVGLAGTASAAGRAPSAADPGELEGSITTSDGGDFTGTVTAYWWPEGGDHFEIWDSVSYDGQASPATYSFTDVAPAPYYVQYDDESNTYATAYGGGVTSPGQTPGDPGVVEVSQSTGATSNLTLHSLSAAHHVTGTVENENGGALADVYVVATRVSDGDYAGDDVTDALGGYGLDLRPGTYDLTFSDLNAVREDATTVITVGTGPLTVDPVVMTPPSRPDVTGLVKGSDDQPLSRARVRLYKLLGDPSHPYDAVRIATVQAGTNGRYRFADVPSGEYYTVGASGYRHALQVLGGGTDPLQGTPELVEADHAMQTLKLTQLVTGVRGTVTSAFGAVGGVDVQLFQWLDGDDFFDVSEIATTDATGHFSFDELAPGDYTLLFDSAAANKPVQTQWLVGTDIPSGPGAAGVIHVGSTPTDVVKDKTLTPLQVTASTTAAKLAKSKIPVGKSTNVTVTVKATGISAPTGKVAVYDGKKLVKTVTLAAAKRGVIAVKLTKPSKGKHKISAKYLGSDAVAASTSKVVTLKVTR